MTKQEKRAYMAEQIRKKRIEESVKESQKRQESYENYLEKRLYNRVNKIAPDHIILDNHGRRMGVRHGS